MSTTLTPAAQRKLAKAAAKAAALQVVPIVVATPDKVEPIIVKTLANETGEVQAAAVVSALSADGVQVAAAALSLCKGNADNAAAYLGDKVLPALHLIRRIIPILRSAAPAALFVDRNNRGARIGELFASRLGLSALYRDASKADLKAARGALVESAK